VLVTALKLSSCSSLVAQICNCNAGGHSQTHVLNDMRAGFVSAHPVSTGPSSHAPDLLFLQVVVLPTISHVGVPWRLAAAATEVVPHAVFLRRCMQRGAATAAMALRAQADPGFPLPPCPYDGLLPITWMAVMGTYPWALTGMALSVTCCAEAVGVLTVAKADANQRACFLHRRAQWAAARKDQRPRS
jgi:hypothetical protein